MLDERYRRMIVNGTLWSLGMETQIKPDLNISFVGPYQPRTFSFNGFAKNVRPADLQSYDSTILPNAEKK